MSKPKVVVWRPMYDQIGHQLFEDAGANLVVVDSTDAQAVMAELPDAQAIWVRTPERITADMMDAAPELVVISTSGFGTDNVDIPAATERGIMVVNNLSFGRKPVSACHHADAGRHEPADMGRQGDPRCFGMGRAHQCELFGA
jgi:lactate dehydrogenase-like 2-hydroxyacid dehydrogenase